ncbi:MAG: DUF262 domain-containing protein [Alcanivorax jadensis]|uniref:GmrSD restriction endonuclease domain-containing protein n=1 Tax=Alcanivorax jadensis TaxID=64988 RepID=UPI003002C955
MKIVSRIYDKRIKSENILIETSIGVYIDLIKDSLESNPYQRKKVTSSKTVYSLLREDIKQGCVIPPIVLSLSFQEANGKSDEDVIQDIQNHKEGLLILDGLQRTHSLLDLCSSLEPADLEEVKIHPLRVEVYLGLNKIGILYRMLTLNTGQTPMSLRQQIEMLYQEYFTTGVEGVRFIREVDQSRATKTEEFNFKEVIAGFNSYLERNEQPLERSDLLENIKSLEKLSHENNQHDLFKEYVLSLYAFIENANKVLGSGSLKKEAIEGMNIWGKDIMRCLKRDQVYAGFGAALGKLKDHSLIDSLDKIPELCKELKIDSDEDTALLSLNSALDYISKNTKKIGNAQRLFFQFYFRDIFNSEGETYLNIESSIESAIHKTKIQLF